MRMWLASRALTHNKFSKKILKMILKKILKQNRVFSKNSHSNNRGFTLVEMLVSVALFAVVMLVSTAVIFSIIGGNKKAQGINAVSNNLNFAIESMVRDIKTGYGYSCYGNQRDADDALGDSFELIEIPLPDPSTSSYWNKNGLRCLPASYYRSITFASTLDEAGAKTVQYKFIRGHNENGVAVPGKLVKIVETQGGGASDPIDVTSPEVDITDVKFFINNPKPGMFVAVNDPNANSSEYGQPSVFVILKGVAKLNDNLSSDFSLQTLISQRILNL